jgi:CRP/FNR family transcriptional regulator, cyclic AMP receptor protein
MLGKWFNVGGGKSAPPLFHDGFPGLNAAEMAVAVELLQNSNTSLPLSREEAFLVAQHLQSRRYIFDQVFMRAGDKSDSDYMLWILDGQAIVEAVSSDPKAPVMVTVLESGNTVGELGLLDGMGRSATCTSGSALHCAMLTRRSLLSLSASHPEVAFKLVLIISINVAARLRDVTDKFQRYVLMANAISAELMSASLPKPIWPNRTFKSPPAPENEHPADPPPL